MNVLCLSSVFAITFLVTPPLAEANRKSDAKAHVAKAMKAHGKNNFELALKELQLAYKLDPSPDLLFAIGQIYVKLDRCTDAIAAYQRYLDTKPAAQAAADTTQAIQSCQQKLLPPPPAEPVVEPPPPAEPVVELPPPVPPSPPVREPVPPVAFASPPPPQAPRSSSSSPWYKDKLGGALVVTGVTAGVLGVVMYAGASSDLDDAEATRSIDQYRQLVDDASSKRTYSVVLVVGGGVLIGASIARYTLRPDRGQATQVGVVPAHGGGLMTWGGRF